MKIHGFGKGKAVYEQLCYKKEEHMQLFFSGNLPHWQQENSLQFVTFRLKDSLPQSVISELRSYMNHQSKDEQDLELQRLFDEKYHSKLDVGYGSCILKSEKCFTPMIECLKRSDGIIYDLFDYVVMPNHVHLIILPYHGKLANCMHLLKGQSARQINKAMNTTGSIWQHGYFDRMIRSVADYENKAAYILNNAYSVSHLYT